jgi:hypothetical protein
MAQAGQIFSVGTLAGLFLDPLAIPPYGPFDASNWQVDFTYQLDAGGTSGPTRVVVGAGRSANVALWASPGSTISIPLGLTPGTTNQVTLSCPPLIKFAAFGIPLR